MTATISRPANDVTAPKLPPPDAFNSRSANARSEPIYRSPSGLDSPAAIPPPGPDPLAPQETTSTGGHLWGDTHITTAAGSNVPGPAANRSAQPKVGSLLDPALCLAADILDDIERVRIANENRLRQLTRTGEDADGEERGFGYDESHPDVARLAAMVEVLRKVEHDAALNLNRKMRKHPLGIWAKSQKGIGEKQGARLLAAIGDPYINSAKGQPRSVSALWAYSGLHVLPGGHTALDAHEDGSAGDQHRDTADLRPHDAHLLGVGVAAKRRKGERANWSTKAKMRAYLIAGSCIKQLSPQCRDGQRVGASHSESAEWTDGHSHNDALRVASKEILKDLWRAARDWHLSNRSEENK